MKQGGFKKTALYVYTNVVKGTLLVCLIAFPESEDAHADRFF